MSEHPGQANFEDALFKEPDKKEGEVKLKYEKQFDCNLCQDVGYCTRCARGRKWLEENPTPDFFPKKKKKR